MMLRTVIAILSLLFLLQGETSFSEEEKGIGYWQDMVSAMKWAGYPEGEAHALLGLGCCYMREGEYEKAIECFLSALKKEKILKEDKACLLNNLGNAYYNIGWTNLAIVYFKRALEVVDELGDSYGRVTILDQIGSAYKSLGNYTEALRSYQEGLKIAQKEGYKEEEAKLHNNIGTIYSMIGVYSKAYECYKEALKIAESTNYAEGKAVTLMNIGSYYQQEGEPPKNLQKALEKYLEALAIAEEGGLDYIKIGAINNIGYLYHELGIFDKALLYYQEGLKMAKEARELYLESALLWRIGRTYERMRKYKEALQSYKDALYIAQRNETAEIIWRSHYGIGVIYERQGYLKEAVQEYISAIEIIEKMGAELREEEFKVMFRAPKIDVYRRLINLLLMMDEEGEIPNEAFKRRYGDDYKEAAFYFTESCKARVFIEILAKARIKEKEEPLPLRKSEVEVLLDDGILFIEYVLSEGGVNFFLVRKGRPLKVYRIEVKDLKKKVIDLWRTIHLLTRIGEFYKLVTKEEDLIPMAKELYNLLLKPIESELQGAKGVVISPDGYLNYLPFEALYQGSQYVVDEPYWISYVASGSVWKQIRSRKKDSQFKFVGFAPYGYKNKEEMKKVVAKTIMCDYYKNRGLQEQVPLPDSRLEIEKIGKIYENRRLFLKEEAKEATAKKVLGEYRDVVISTHGLADDERPMDSCVLMQEGEGEDGYLRAEEVLYMNLSGVDIVALSACQTALGKDVTGEGIIGLTRAFISAGVNKVLSSLWSVESISTANLMVEFFKKRKAGLPDPYSLKFAKRVIKSDYKYKHPFFWAPFVIIGE